MFVVFYRGELIVQEAAHLQYYVEFDKEIYRKKPEKSPDILQSLVPTDYRKWVMENKQEKIRKAAADLAFPYQIEFVTEAGFAEYLMMIEKEVATLRISAWPVTRASKPEISEP